MNDFHLRGFSAGLQLEHPRSDWFLLLLGAAPWPPEPQEPGLGAGLLQSRAHLGSCWAQFSPRNVPPANPIPKLFSLWPLSPQPGVGPCSLEVTCGAVDPILSLSCLCPPGSLVSWAHPYSPSPTAPGLLIWKEKRGHQYLA